MFTLTTVGEVTTAVKGPDKTIVAKVIDGILDPFTLKNETLSKEVQEKSELQYTVGVWLLGGVVLGSKVTRSRLAKDPDAKPWLQIAF